MSVAPPIRRVVLSDRDRLALELIAEHRLVVADQVAALLGVSTAAAQSRLRALVAGGFVDREQAPGSTSAPVAIRRRGLDAIGSDRAVPRNREGGYRHDLALAWLWLSARQGAFGELRDTISERRMRAEDIKASHQDDDRSGKARHAVTLGGIGPGGRRRTHYPDLVLVTAGGRRIAVELELSLKSRTRREAILAGYAADRRIDAVLYLVESPAIGRKLQASARKLGIGDLVHVQRVNCAERNRTLAPGRQLVRTRPRSSATTSERSR